MLLNHCRLIKELSGNIATEDGAVEIKNGKITAVYEKAVEAYDGRTIDCDGRTLMPGLMDIHTHLIGIRYYTPELMKSPIRLFMQTAEVTKKYLDYGFTTVRDCGTPMRAANFVRDGIEHGLIEGPRVVSSGCILSPTEIEEMDSIYEMYQWADGADAMRKAARKELAEHADYIKIMASGSAFHKQGIPVQPIITEAEIRAAVDVAEMKDTYVGAHAHGDGAIRLCVDCGVRTIEHASFIGEETLEAAQKKGDVYLVPTLSAMYQNPAQTPPEMEFLLDKLKNMLEISSVCIKNAYEAGMKLGFATDSTVGMDQYEEGIEFRFRSELCGMSNVDILLQATKVNAEIIGLADTVGEIRENLSADLIIVDGKPDEDISVMYHKPEMVFKSGKRVR